MTAKPNTMKYLPKFLRLLAPYGLLLTPALLWLMLAGHHSDGAVGTTALEATALYLAFAAAALVMHKWHPGAASLLGGLLLLAFAQEGPQPVPGQGQLRVAQLHLTDSIAPVDAVAADAALQDLDFISLRDSGAGHLAALSCALERTFPYTFHCVDAQDSGVAVFSRYPLTALQVEWWADKPHLSGKVHHPQGEVAFLAGGGPDSISTEVRLQASAAHLRQTTGPRIMLDAFVKVPQNESIATFKHQSGLRDGRYHLLDLHPEWAELIPDSVDYIFHSAEINCQEFHRLETDMLRGVAGIYRFNSDPKAAS